jgi:hypothetical protein
MSEIGVTIISGIILVPISFHITNLIDQSKRKTSAMKVNKEVLNILRNIVSEGGEVTLSTVNILITSISRKYGIRNKYVRTSEQMIQDLITDVLKSSYIPMDTKLMITSSLEKIANNIVVDSKENNHIEREKSKLFLIVYFILTTVVIFGAVLTVINTVKESSNNSSSIFTKWWFYPIIIYIFSGIYLSTIGKLDEDFENFKRKLLIFFGLEDA